MFCVTVNFFECYVRKVFHAAMRMINTERHEEKEGEEGIMIFTIARLKLNMYVSLFTHLSFIGRRS